MISHDKKINNMFIYWLKLNLLLVFSIIIVGGLTRLTNSGLSIIEWELFSGILPPMNNQSWLNYFELYKTIPQYKIINSTMSLNEFKIIFYWEYAHRLLGRIIGLFYLLPLVYFYLNNKIFKNKMPIFLLILLLIILQGAVGWYMVKSGLVNDVTVSHYRLSLHLSLALIIISLIFWQITCLEKKRNKIFFKFTKKNIPYLLLIFLIFVQIILGAFVSGLDAGKIYQTWPLMGLNYFPDDLQIKSFLDLKEFSNHSLVQFYHRNLAYFISFYILVLSFWIFRKKETYLFKPVFILIGILIIQIFLGIITLLSNLNIVIALGHQITSVIFILSALNLYYSAIK